MDLIVGTETFGIHHPVTRGGLTLIFAVQAIEPTFALMACLDAAPKVGEPQSLRTTNLQQGRGVNDMKFFYSNWERIRLSLTPTQLRIGLAILSMLAMALGGSASSHWD
jgi:hypothetical protein